MKGTIRANLGQSRYIVGVPYAAEPLASLKKDAQQQYEQAIKERLEAQKALNAAREPYDAILTEIEWASASYDVCRIEFNYDLRLEEARAICTEDYSDCYFKCNPIEGESKTAEEIFACQKACAKVRDACYEQAAIDVKNREIEHLTKCQETWSPLIAELQAQALELLPPVQDALYRLETAEFLELQATLRINELAQVQANEQQITCFKAQYDDGLTAGTEVEVARTPAGRHVITEIFTPNEHCLHEARGLPAKHLFNNAALYPGFETWRPSWRVGVVKAKQGDKLQIEIQSGTMTGSLGTIYSRNPINCTPPQAYFDGNWQTAEEDIGAARDALTAAQATKAGAVSARDACIAQYDPPWMSICYTTAAGVCDQTWAAWLANCEEVGGDNCLEEYEAYKAICYQQSMGNCDTERDGLIETCRTTLQPAVDVAQAAVEDAEQNLNNELAGRYQPANPLILSLPIEHCYANRYEIDDRVLIDFPVRTGTEPMTVWDSGRVIGWSDETRRCAGGILLNYGYQDSLMADCDGEIAQSTVSVPASYWSGMVGGRSTLVYWAGTGVWQKTGVIANVSHTVACAALREISVTVNGDTTKKNLLLYATEVTSPAGLKVYGRDLSIPVEQQQDTLIATLNFPANHNDNFVAGDGGDIADWYGTFYTYPQFSPDTTKIGVLMVGPEWETDNTFGFTWGYKGKVYIGTLPAFSWPVTAAQTASFSVFDEGDPQAEISATERRMIIGAKWQNDTINVFDLLLEKQITTQPIAPNYSSESPLNLPIIPSSEEASTSETGTSGTTISNTVSVTPTGHSKITLLQYDYSSTQNVIAHIRAKNQNTPLHVYYYISASGSRTTSETLQYRVMGLVLPKMFNYPLIYFSDLAIKYHTATGEYLEKSMNSVECMSNPEDSSCSQQVEDAIPEVWEAFTSGVAEHYDDYFWAYGFQQSGFDESTTYNVNAPNFEFYTGDNEQKAGEITIQKGSATDAQLFSWYQANINDYYTGSTFMGNVINCASHHVTIPCPAAQVRIDSTVTGVSVQPPALLVAGDEISRTQHPYLDTLANSMTPLDSEN